SSGPAARATRTDHAGRGGEFGSDVGAMCSTLMSIRCALRVDLALSMILSNQRKVVGIAISGGGRCPYYSPVACSDGTWMAPSVSPRARDRRLEGGRDGSRSRRPAVTASDGGSVMAPSGGRREAHGRP